MKRLSAILALAALVTVAGCAFHGGRVFPSPDRAQITVGATDKAALLQVFGEPYQIGLDSGDQTWRWFYLERSFGSEASKDLTVRFNPDGTVKSYSFTSNFPDDMTKLR